MADTGKRSMPIVQSGIARSSIVLPPCAGEVERFAANELARYVKKITGAELAIGTLPAEGMLPAYVGTRSSLAAHGVTDLPEPKKGYDGYVIQFTPQRLLIAGENARGTLYGVYDFLERCGCRWYYPDFDPKDPEIIPTSKTLAMQPFAVSCAAGFRRRVAHIGSMIYQLDPVAAKKHTDWAAKARYNVLAFLIAGKGTAVPAQVTAEQMPPPPGAAAKDFYDAMWQYKTSGVVNEMQKRGLMLEGPSHCFIHFLPNELFETHPEWFGMRNGVRRRQGGWSRAEFCWSNADAVNVATDNMVAWIQAFPYLDTFVFAPNDGGIPCECPECTKQTPCDLYMNIANIVLKKLRAAGSKVAVTIDAAYPPVEGPPRKVFPDPAIRVEWSHWGRNHDAWYGAADYAHRKLLDDWLALGHEFVMCEFYADGLVSPSIQPPVPKAMKQDNAWLLQKGVLDNYMLMYPLEQWWGQGLSAWLGICFYYTDRDPFAFLEDYCRHYFGAAGQPMTDYYTILSRELWLSYYCCGSRWCPPRWVDSRKGQQAEALLKQLEISMARAESLAKDPLDAYRLSRPAHQFRVLSLMGQAVIRNNPLVLDVAKAKKGEIAKPPVIARLKEAIAHEEQVVDPAVQSLLDRRNGTIAAWMAERLMRNSAKAMRKDLQQLEE